MRTLEEASSQEVRTLCLAGHRDDERSGWAFDFAIEWFRLHPPTESEDRLMLISRCRRAVEVRGRNDKQINDWWTWGEVVDEVVHRLFNWMLPAKQVAVSE